MFETVGRPVLEINVADEQIEDLVDDAIQYFQERHFDGVGQIYLKYQITHIDVDRGKARPPVSAASSSGKTIGWYCFNCYTQYCRNRNNIHILKIVTIFQIPPNVIGINKVFQYDDAQSIIIEHVQFQVSIVLERYLLLGNTDLLSYSNGYVLFGVDELPPEYTKQIRFNQRKDRMYLDIDWSNLKVGEFIIIDCWRTDPNDYPRVYNDSS